jgi:Icc-related predicted phosphoesterase
MTSIRKALPIAAVLLIAVASVAFLAHDLPAPIQPLELQQSIAIPFRFVALGDTRFTDSTDPEVSNGAVRRAIVQAIAEQKPALISFGGDIVYRGDHTGDWQVWDSETSAWRDEKIPVYPALGNHDLHGNQKTALSNYFQRFPVLQEHRYYSVRFANCLMLALDSVSDEMKGQQGVWLRQTLNKIPADVAFVIIVLHHPPYTSSSDHGMFGDGHSARSAELELARLLEEKQSTSRARFVVFGGHVHNYERHQHGGVTYFVTGGGGAHAYPVERTPSDLFQSATINYHYLLGEVSKDSMKITMNRIEIVDGKAVWTQPDSVTIKVPTSAAGPNLSPIRQAANLRSSRICGLRIRKPRICTGPQRKAVNEPS